MKDKMITKKEKTNSTDNDINVEKISKDVSKQVQATTYAVDGRFMLVKVGSDKEKANSEDIEAVEEKINRLLSENGIKCVAFVTHHLVEIQLF